MRGLQREGHYEESIEPLKSMLEVDPHFGEANYRLGDAFYKTKRPSLAVWALLRAEEDPEWAVRAGLVGAIALIQSKNNESAIETATRVLERSPDNLEALGLRAQAKLAAVTDLDGALADIEKVLELDPDNATALQPQAAILLRLDRIEDAAEVLAKIEQGALDGIETGKAASHWCLTRAIFAREKGDLSLAEQRFEGCLEDYVGDRMVVREVIRFYSETERRERAEELLREELELRPGQLEFARDLAARLVRRGDLEEATAFLEAAVDAQPSGKTFDALWALFEHHEQLENFDTAATVLARAIRLDPDPRLPFRLVDVLILAGKLGHALRLTNELEGEVYVELARGRILLAQGKPKEALERLHAGIRLWPNNPGARYFAAIAAEQLGRFDLAVKEYRDSIRAGADASDAGLNLAHLLEAQGDYVGALSALSHYRKANARDTLDAVLLEVRLTSLTGKRGHLDKAVARLAKLPGQSGRAVCLRAEAGAFAGGQGAVVASLRESGLDLSDPENLDVLRCLVDSLIKLAATDKALKEVDQAIAGSLAGNAFQALRARVLRARGDPISQLRAACELAMKFDPNDAENLACLARVEGEDGNTAAAVALYDRALIADPKKVDYTVDAAQLLLASGDSAAGKARLRAALLEHPYEGRVAEVLARHLVEEGVELEVAQKLAKRAVRFRAGPRALDTMGWIQLELGDTSTAVETFTRAVNANSGSPSVRYRLARALLADGRTNEARGALTEALKSDSFPERDRAREELERLGTGT